MPASALLALVWHMERHLAGETQPLAQERLRVLITHIRQESMQRALRKSRIKTPA